MKDGYKQVRNFMTECLRLLGYILTPMFRFDQAWSSSDHTPYIHTDSDSNPGTSSCEDTVTVTLLLQLILTF